MWQKHGTLAAAARRRQTVWPACRRPRPQRHGGDGGGGSQGLEDGDAADASAGLSAASRIDATARTAAGIGPDEDMVGAAAEARLRDGSANGAGWTWGFTDGDAHIAYRLGPTRGGSMHDK